MTHSLWPEQWWSACRTLERDLWRGVEAQHLVATMRLVDTLDEQAVLEEILEGSKPPLDLPLAGVHYLVASPFRYRSPHPSRFREAHHAGIWYGAEELHTACTELAYWRWRFLIDSEGLAESGTITELTFFQAHVAGDCIDLSVPPWDRQREHWTAPDDYSACHALAAACRDRGVGWIRYESARKIEGHCAAVFRPTCLSLRPRGGQQTWVCKVTKDTAILAHEDERVALRFGR